ncbi:MAG TPA: hypothetical protein PKG52_06990 [bacterium]|nr:hypothetical protein [bacterium]HPS28937.1 hypothetical protein [bacterium]
MKLLVSFVARQSVVQSAVIQEARPDHILFISTPMAAENGWNERIPMLVARNGNILIPYTNIFITEDISLSVLVETVKKHLHSIMKKMKLTELFFDASSGKGIHRIAISEYLKNLAEKKGMDFFLVYFDADTRQMRRICLSGGAFSEYKSSVSIDWNIKDRLSFSGAELAGMTDILVDGYDFFSESKDQYDELYSNLCSSMILRAFFSSYDNIKSIVDTTSKSEDLKFSEVAFNRFKQKYVKDFEKESQLNIRSQISVVFEKIVSYAVYKAVMNNPILRESVASIHQNVKIDGKANSLIEIDTLVMFRNGYIHVFETKSSHASNKDINSKILVLRRYLGESTGMDIVFPFTAEDIAAFEEKNERFLRRFYSKGLKNGITWVNFFSSTDKDITPVDMIAERLIDIALRYN